MGTNADSDAKTYSTADVPAHNTTNRVANNEADRKACPIADLAASSLAYGDAHCPAGRKAHSTPVVFSVPFAHARRVPNARAECAAHVQTHVEAKP